MLIPLESLEPPHSPMVELLKDRNPFRKWAEALSRTSEEHLENYPLKRVTPSEKAKNVLTIKIYMLIIDHF